MEAQEVPGPALRSARLQVGPVDTRGTAPGARLSSWAVTHG